jgi:2'-5' RNA ligase
MTTIRAFIAIPLPSSLQERLGALQRGLERRVPPNSVRWVRPKSIHLTLKFLGDIPRDDGPVIGEALSVVARHAPAFTYTAEGLGCFPHARRPRVVWVGIQEPSGKLAALQGAIEEALGPLGYPPERRAFTPHLTLGRVRRRTSRADAARIGEVIDSRPCETLAAVSVERFSLIQSVLKPSGAEYTPLATFQLHS